MISDCIIITTIGINEDFKEKVVIYPNPAKDSVTINLGAVYEGTTILLTDITGRILEKNKYGTTDKIHLRLNVSSGTYFINIKTKTGNKVRFKLLVK